MKHVFRSLTGTYDFKLTHFSHNLLCYNIKFMTKKNHMHAVNTGRDFLLTLNFLERNSKRVRRTPIDIKSLMGV